MRAPTLIVFGLLAGLFAADLGAANAAYADRGNAIDPRVAQSGATCSKGRPMSEVISKVQARYPGQLLDAICVERIPGQPRYRVLIFQSDGKRIAVWVDATTGNILRVDG